MSNKLTIEKIVAFLIFFYWLLFEHYLAFYSQNFGVLFHLVVLSSKMVLPFILVSYSGVNLKFFKEVLSGLYLLFFSLFIFWLLVVTLFKGNLIEWFKLLPRYIFFIAILNIFYKNRRVFEYVFQFIIYYVLLAVFLYTLGYLLNGYSSVTQIAGLDTAGIKGFYTNITSRMFFPGLSTPIVRLNGYWNEPSNAAGTAFASYFICKYLGFVSKSSKWNIYSYFCLIAGFLCLSNAGYVAIGAAYLIGILWKRRSGGKRTFYELLFANLMLLLIVFAFVGRLIVLEYNIESIWFRALVGARDLNTTDVYGGRFSIVSNVLNYLKNSPWGNGLDTGYNDYTLLSASAIFYWLFIGGLPGLVLLLSRELSLIGSMRNIISTKPENIFIVQAAIAIIIQQISYGSWMNPNYLIFASIIIVKVYTK